MGEGIVLTVPNHHGECSGKAPELVAEKYFYTSYFENEHGEQLVFIYPKGGDRAILYHGGKNWDDSITLVPGGTLIIMLDADEKEWLLLCWKVARKFRR